MSVWRLALPGRIGLVRWAGAAAALLLLVVGVAPAADPVFPALTGRVVDEAAILSPQAVDQISQMLAQHEQATGNQIVVATVKSLQGDAIEDFGYRLGRYWGIGQRGRDNGAILLVAPNDHKVRIEVGYGLEDRLTDAQCRAIIDSVILPSVRRGDFNTGVSAGAAAMLRVLSGEQVLPPTAASPAPSSGGASVEAPAVAIFAVWLIPFLIIAIWVLVIVSAIRHQLDPRYRRGHGSYWVGSSSGSFDSSSSSSGSDSGFSGGGGSFGGGGASGSW